MTFSMSRAVLGDKQVRVYTTSCKFNSLLVWPGPEFLSILSVFPGTLSSIPTALTRWTDECKVLDAESMHDCVAGMLVLDQKTEVECR